MESMHSSCPFCNLNVPLTEIERHANDHLVEEELAKDVELAYQIAWDSSPPRLAGILREAENSINDFAGSSLETSTSRSGGNEATHGAIDIEEKTDALVHLQLRSVFYKVEHGLLSLLRSCLELEKGKSSIIMSGHVDHFQSLESEDLGWGCGWRNIQMMSSYLLKEREEATKVLFGGSGFVPDIPSLQRWLEIAWEMGFDVTGSEAFNNKIFGSRRWIGTTECAALLRFFGLRARIIDFGCKTLKDAMTHNNGVALERSLQQNVGWQKFIKRGVHTLKKSQYQLCYVDCGIASGEELQQLKTIDSIFYEV